VLAGSGSHWGTGQGLGRAHP